MPHPPAHGGSIRTRLLLDAIAVDHRVHLAAPVANDADREHLAELATVVPLQAHAVPASASGSSGLARKLRAWLRGRSELLARRWGDGAAAVVAAIAAQVRPDAIVADSSFVLPVLPPSATPLVLHLHNLEGALFARRDATRRSWSERLTRRCEARAIAAAEARALARAAVAITVSEPDRELARRLAPAARVECVPVTVDLARIPLLPPPAPPTPGPVRLLFVGTIDYPPNLEAITELVAEHLPVLRDAFPGLVARLVGRDHERLLARFAGAPGVEVIGTTDDLRPHYEASHAVYLPIRTGGGMRGKIVEAWAYGRPVLSTAVGAEGTAGVEGEHWRRFETPQQGVVAVRDVLADAGARLVQRGRALAEQRYSHAGALAALRAIVRGVTPGR